MFIFALKFHALSEEELRRNTSPPQRAGRFYSRRELGSWRGSMSLPRRGARLWMGGGMPDTRSIPMAETRGAHCQAHARPESARQVTQSSQASRVDQASPFGAPSAVERALDAKPNRAAEQIRAEQAHRGKQSRHSKQSPAGASSTVERGAQRQAKQSCRAEQSQHAKPRRRHQAKQARQYTHCGRRSALLPLRSVTSNMNGNAHL